MNIKDVLGELDRLYKNKEIDKVEEFLMDKLEEAMKDRDTNSVITLLNEMIGYQRDSGQYDKSILYSNQVMKLMENLGLSSSTYYGTTLINVANAYRAAGKLEEALTFFNQVFELYEGQIDKQDMLYANLYNNMSLLYQEMGDFQQAVDSLKKALDIVTLYKNNDIKIAVTYGNLGESLLKLGKYDEAINYLNHAMDIYIRDEVKDFHYGATLSAMGEATYRTGDYRLAAICYENALKELEINVGKTSFYDITMENLNKVYEKLNIGREEFLANEDVIYEHWYRANKVHMKGMDLCREYYEEYGIPMIKENFSEYENRIAVGLVGDGSECYGFDDEYSVDHDFGPGFIMWLDEEDYRKIGNALMEAYEKLPKDYRGYRRITTKEGKKRVGVCQIGEFYSRYIDREDAPNREEEWLALDEVRVAAATNGQVFRDDLGKFSAIREKLLAYYPDRVWKLKMANSMALMSQLGQYNLSRVLDRGDRVTGRIILSDYMKETMRLVYMINRQYPPFYKWLYKGMENLRCLPEIKKILLDINDRAITDKRILRDIDKISVLIDNAFKEMMTMDNSKTKEELVEEIVALEWKAFDKVENEGGRANCQDDWDTFSIMRKSQYNTWTMELLNSFIEDFNNANARGWNLITEKYGRMMKSTAPERYKELEASFPVIPEQKQAIIEAIVKIQVDWMEDFAAQYPKTSGTARTIRTSTDTAYNTSYETYLRGEISTYSDRTLELYGRFIAALAKEGKNLAKITMDNTAKLYDYKDVDDLENRLN